MKKRDTKTAEKIEVLEGLIRGHKNRIRCAQSDMENEGFYLRKRERLTSLIEKYQAELDTLEYNRENGDEIIRSSWARIRELRAEIKLLEKQKDLERLRELQEKIKELQEGLTLQHCETVFSYGSRSRNCEGFAEAIIEVDGNAIAVCEECRQAFENSDHPYHLRGKALRDWKRRNVKA